MSRTIKEINEIVEAVMEDPEVNAALDARVYRNMERYFDRKDGYTEGEKDGGKKKQIEIAKKMLAKGKNIEEIIEFTELSKEEIEKLKFGS